MSKAAEKRESKRQQFIETTLAHMEALAGEMCDEPWFLNDAQFERLHELASTLDSLAERHHVIRATEGK